MSFFKKDELKYLWPFYLDSLLLSILFIYPAFIVPYLINIGFSLFQLGLFTSVFGIASMIFEVPTGAIADKFGRKFSTRLGFFLSGVVVLIAYFFKSFYILLILVFLWGAFGTFISGARDAWIVDLLKSKKRKDLVSEYYTKNHSFAAFGMLMSGIVGALLVKKLGVSILWIATGGSFILTFIAYGFAAEHFIKSNRIKTIGESLSELILHTKKSVRYSWNHKVLFRMLLMILIISLGIGFVGDLTWYPLLQNYGLADYYFGYFFSCTFILSMVIPFLIKPLAKKIGGYVKFLTLVLGLMAVILFLTYFTSNLVYAIVIAIVFFSMWDFFHPARSILFQEFTPSKMRATIGSLESMIYSIGITISYPLVGLLATKIGVQNAIAVGGFIFIIAAGIIWGIREKR